MSKREILFRGQTRRKGEKVRMSGEPINSNWVYGGIFPGEGDFSIIYQTKPKIEKFTVYSDTVGQYTGLADKNGRKIFEGDILLTPYPSNSKIYSVIWHSGSFMRRTVDGYYLSLSNLNADEYEVCGNIHDNPELLKGE